MSEKKGAKTSEMYLSLHGKTADQAFALSRVPESRTVNMVDGSNRYDSGDTFDCSYTTGRQKQGSYFSVFNAGKDGYKVRHPTRNVGRSHNCNVLVGKLTQFEMRAKPGADDWKDTRPKFEVVEGYQFHDLNDSPDNDLGSSDGYVVGEGDVIRVVEKGRKDLNFFVKKDE